MNLDELEKLAKSSGSQSWVSIEIDDLLNLIAVVRAAGVYAFEGHHEGCPGSEDGNWNCPCGYLKVAQALAALEESDRT